MYPPHPQRQQQKPLLNERSCMKYTESSNSHHFFPLSIKNLGFINPEGWHLISELGHRITAVNDD
jgi:hypothetical protein